MGFELKISAWDTYMSIKVTTYGQVCRTCMMDIRSFSDSNSTGFWAAAKFEVKCKGQHPIPESDRVESGLKGKKDLISTSLVAKRHRRVLADLYKRETSSVSLSGSRFLFSNPFIKSREWRRVLGTSEFVRKERGSQSVRLSMSYADSWTRPHPLYPCGTHPFRG